MMPSHEPLRVQTTEILTRLGVELENKTISPNGPEVPAPGHLIARSPVTGGELARIAAHTRAEVEETVARAADAFAAWRLVPGPVRGQLVREFGNLLREHKDDLGALVSIEAGKIRSEGLGEVQEMIDICDLAVGQSRQLFGLTIASERPGHRMMEQWHPLGVVGVISAFNFPVAVWSWNTALALVCGDTVVWKPSEKTMLTALACQALLAAAARRTGAPDGVSALVLGGPEAGAALVEDPRVALVSATGSTRMGRSVAPVVAQRFGRLLLELGGNNAAIVAPSADLDLTVRGIVFAAAGTAGQRCTTLRRVIAHSSVADELVERLAAAYRTLPIGSPLETGTLVGPLIDAAAYQGYTDALAQAQADGGKVVVGGRRVLVEDAPEAYYVEPTIVRMNSQTDVVRRETFAPILYVLPYESLDEAIALHNDVPQGLSSSIFTLDMREAERFLAPDGSDCGIANVNIGPSGAEIGGAFGGEKETGGGRESGSDAWKAYMRRATNTVNYSTDLPLAQGVTFALHALRRHRRQQAELSGQRGRRLLRLRPPRASAGQHRGAR
jgi:L-aminoadipate-semialdehyde dehydrogenase